MDAQEVMHMTDYKYICYSTALPEGGLMKQSNNKKSRDVTAFLYERLSRDDNLEGESYSIGNQKKLLAKVAKEKGYTNLVHFLDDGISGVTMDRPGFVEMICQLEQGKAAAVFVKDLSRLGRNYIEVGRLTEEFFPDHDIRLVAVSDNIDTAEGENELAPIRNLFNVLFCFSTVFANGAKAHSIVKALVTVSLRERRLQVLFLFGCCL